MKEEHKLNPCPFCGSTDIVIAQNPGFSSGGYVMCRGCCATTRSSVYTDKAVAHWNRRTHMEGGGKNENT